MLEACAAEPFIRKREVDSNSAIFYLSPEFSSKYCRKYFQISYPEDLDLKSLPSSIVDIPVITNTIAVIWLSGNEYSIEEMDEDLYASLIKIKSFFKRFFYNTSWEGELKPKRLVKNVLTKKSSQAAALFTGGLDSTTTALRHLEEELILLSFNDPHKTAVEFSKIHHLDLYTIHANYSDFLKYAELDRVSCDISKWFWDTTMGLSWVGMAAPFLYAKGISVLYIPSGFTWRSFIFPDGQTLEQPASPLIDENLSPCELRVWHDVFTMTRVDKTKFISTFCSERNLPKPHLVVCNHHRRGDQSYSHCNGCMKCLLTMLGILAVGEDLQEYGFTLSDPEFMARFTSFLDNLKMRRGGTYDACRDAQTYIRQHIDHLPADRRSFYEWFISLDLWARVDKSSNRPLRDCPFSWSDYQDLYPGVECYVD